MFVLAKIVHYILSGTTCYNFHIISISGLEASQTVQTLAFYGIASWSSQLAIVSFMGFGFRQGYSIVSLVSSIKTKVRFKLCHL